MQHETFVEIFENQIDTCREVLVNKGREYGAVDRLHNFKQAAHLEGVPLKTALAGMMAKHTVSVYDMCVSEDDYTAELWDEKITDHLNYLFLLKAVLMEEEDKKSHSNVVKKYTSTPFGFADNTPRKDLNA